MRNCRHVTRTGMYLAAMQACPPCLHQRRGARLKTALRMATSLSESVMTSYASVLVVWGMSSTVMMDFSSTLLSMCVIGLGTTLGVVKTVQILHQLQQLGLPSAQPKTQRRSVLTTALRQIMECMLRVVVRTLTASALLGKDIFTNALLTQSSILRRDFVTLRVY